MAAHTIAEVQEALKRLGYDPGTVDGAAGPRTAEAVAAFQGSVGLPVDGLLNGDTLAALFPSPAVGPRTIQGTIADYFLNLVKSKTTWAAAAGAAFIITWVNTKFGLNLGADAQGAVTTLLALGMTAVIGVLQTFFNSPHMTNKQPSVVNKPAEFK